MLQAAHFWKARKIKVKSISLEFFFIGQNKMCVYTNNTSVREIPFWIQSVLTQCPQLHENLQEVTCHIVCLKIL